VALRAGRALQAAESRIEDTSGTGDGTIDVTGREQIADVTHPSVGATDGSAKFTS
jgi:hypothetical protein